MRHLLDQRFFGGDGAPLGGGERDVDLFQTNADQLAGGADALQAQPPVGLDDVAQVVIERHLPVQHRRRGIGLGCDRSLIHVVTGDDHLLLEALVAQVEHSDRVHTQIIELGAVVFFRKCPLFVQASQKVQLRLPCCFIRF